MGFVKNKRFYNGEVYEWNLPAGWTCPFAKDCKVRVYRDTGKFIIDGKVFRCYASMSERFPAVREHRWNNYLSYFNEGIPDLPKGCKNVRIHGSGDFFSMSYFVRWLEYCEGYKDVNFWAFTKSIRYWVDKIDVIPDNLILTASYGGVDDGLIKEYGLKSAVVVRSKMEADSMGLEIDVNDDLARVKDISFALLDNFKRN